MDEPHQLGHGVHLELLHHAAAMLLDRLLGGAKRRRDDLVHFARGHERQHLTLARREALDPTPNVLELRAVASPSAVALERDPDGADEIFVAHRLREKLQRPGFYCAHAHRDRRLAGDEDDGDRRVHTLQLSGHIEPAAVGQVYVEHEAGRRVGALVAEEFPCRSKCLHAQPDRSDHAAHCFAGGKIVVHDIHDPIIRGHYTGPARKERGMVAKITNGRVGDKRGSAMLFPLAASLVPYSVVHTRTPPPLTYLPHTQPTHTT